MRKYRLHFDNVVSFRSTEINMTVKQIKTPCPAHLWLGMLGMLGNFPSIPLRDYQFSPLAPLMKHCLENLL